MDRMEQCQAKSKRSGRRCKRYASKGRKVCRMHGGILGNKKAQKKRCQAVLRHGLHTQKARLERKKVCQFIRECRRAYTGPHPLRQEKEPQIKIIEY